MTKFCAILLLVLSFGATAQADCAQGSCDEIFHISESQPEIQGMEIELEDGTVISLQQFLKGISKEGQIIKAGGEVPWPKEGKGKKDEDS